MASARLASLFTLLTLTISAPSQGALLFDNSSRQDATTPRDVGSSPVAAITVAAPTSINQIGAMVDLALAGNLKFLIFNLDTSALLLTTTSTAFADTGLGFKVSTAFAPFTLNPGTNYGIGAIADVAGLWGTNNSSSGNPFLQNGISASDDLNGNVGNFASPSVFCCGAAMVIVQLYGATATVVVPEPSSIGFVLFGLGAISLGCSKYRSILLRQTHLLTKSVNSRIATKRSEFRRIESVTNSDGSETSPAIESSRLRSLSPKPA